MIAAICRKSIKYILLHELAPVTDRERFKSTSPACNDVKGDLT